MNRIQQISLRAIVKRPLPTSKKIANVKAGNPRLAGLKPLPRISSMMTKKHSQQSITEEAPSKTKKTEIQPQSHTETQRPGSATISSPYAGSAKTRITIKYDVGFGNTLYLRGQGANLNWDKGLPMRNIKADEWIWETEIPFSTAEFKALINDKSYEIGRNHLLHCGTAVQYTPRF